MAKYLDLIWEKDTETVPPSVFADPHPGDLLLYRVGRAPAHSAICVGWPYVIHANDEHGVVRTHAALNALGPKSRPLCSVWRARGLR